MPDLNIETVKPQTIDGVEFYVSNDGKHTGLSIRGLARLAGVDESSLRGLLKVLTTAGKAAPKQLEALRDNVYSCGVVGINNATIIDYKAASRIIRYYAYESKAANDMAKTAYNIFAEKGLDSWIKEVTGYQEPVKETSDPTLVAVLQQLIGKVDGFERKLDGLNYAAKVYPTLEVLVEPNDYLALSSAETYTVKDWLDLEQGSIELNPSQYMRLCTTIAIAYKALTGLRPESRVNKKATPIRVYRQEHFKLMSECLAKLD